MTAAFPDPHPGRGHRRSYPCEMGARATVDAGG